MKFTKKYCNQLLFLLAILLVGFLCSKSFIVRENLTRKSNLGCKKQRMHWGWPGTKPPAPRMYGF